VQQGLHALDTRPGRVRAPRLAIWLALAAMLVAVSGAVALVASAAKSHHGSTGVALRARKPLAATSVLSGSPEVVAARAVGALFVSAPAVIVANADSRADVTAASALARKHHAPLLLATAKPASAAALAMLHREVRALHATKVLSVGIATDLLSGQLPKESIITNAAGLPKVKALARLRHVVVLVHRGSTSPAALAVAATARVAGVRVVTMRGYDPRVSPAIIRELAAIKPRRVLAIGSAFGPAAQLAAKVAVAATGVQLPGGGQILFPMRKVVALYGNPTTPALGALGEQGLTASIARAKRVAAQYRSLTNVPVIPGFEIIATVAQGSPGPTGSYSYESSPASLRPWINAATANGMYVILDLQPGRDNFLEQAKLYRSLLMRPNVGLALDPEWKLQPGQLPLQQIGSVNISQVNAVITWLSRLTARYHLPQKLLELHQFRLSMLQNEAALDTRHDDLAIVINMDGQGAPSTKQQTWDAIISAAPRGVYFGWKDFFVKDTPMLDPQRTIDRTPVPVLISYE
jgi:hypothetical protein